MLRESAGMTDSSKGGISSATLSKLRSENTSSVKRIEEIEPSESGETEMMEDAGSSQNDGGDASTGHLNRSALDLRRASE